MTQTKLDSLNQYITDLIRIYERVDSLGEIGGPSATERDTITFGYEQKARPIIDLLEMHNPKSKKFYEGVVDYDNEAELLTKVTRADLIYSGIAFLKQVSARYEYCLQNPEECNFNTKVGKEKNAVERIVDLLERFHGLSKIITSDRRRGHSLFEIKDEYDVQDLLLLILKSYFPLAERESPTISVGKGHTRIDIVIPEYDIIVEVKIILNEAKTQDVIDELKVDFESYYPHPSCKTLICFIYDPNTVIKDPTKIINDLSDDKKTIKDKTFKVIVAISPK